MNEKSAASAEPDVMDDSNPNTPTDLLADDKLNTGPDSDLAASTAPAETKQAHRGAEKKRSVSNSTRRRPWLAAGGVALGMLALGLSFGNSPIWWPATFRLVGATDFVGLQGVGPVILNFDAERWSVNGATRIKPDAGKDISGDALGVKFTPAADGGAVSKSLTGMELHIQATEPSGAFQLRVQRMGTRTSQIKLVLVDAKAHLSVRVPNPQFGRPSLSTGDHEPSLSIEQSLQMELDTRGASILFTLPPGAQFRLVRAMPVQRLGFAPLSSGMSVGGERTHVTELVEGTLVFLVLPETKIQLSRGSDLRFGEVSANIESLVVTDKTIEFAASGTASDVRLFFGDHSRSVKPTLLNAATGFAPLMFAVGLAGTCVTLLGLYFAFVSARSHL